jgi:hypothetical protein
VTFVPILPSDSRTKTPLTVLNQYIPPLIPLVNSCAFSEFDLGDQPPTITRLRELRTSKYEPDNGELVGILIIICTIENDYYNNTILVH